MAAKKTTEKKVEKTEMKEEKKTAKKAAEKKSDTKEKPSALRPGGPAAHPSNAYCCFRQDLTGFTPKDRTGPSLHRAHGNG